jgi:uncharacterized protein YggE
LIQKNQAAMKIPTILISIFLLFFPLLSWAQTSTDNSTIITVTGSGSAKVPQNSTSIYLTIQNRANKAQDAQRMTASAVKRVICALNEFNVTDLQTENISLQPIYNYSNSSPQLIAFESTESISYKILPEFAGQTLDGAVRAGANIIDSLESVSNQDQLNIAYNEALQKATQDAQDKALLVANTLNVCLVSPLTVNIEPRYYSIPTPTIFATAVSMESTASTGSNVAPTVIPGNTDVSATVVVVYSQTPC